MRFNSQAKSLYFLKKDLIMIAPIFRSKPAFDVGIPTLRAICCLATVKPIARFHENVTPGIFIATLCWRY